MATLAEIMARKAGGASAPLAPSGETNGTVIRAADERGKLAANIKQTLDACAPPMPPKVQAPAQQRELGATETGERIPMDQPPQGAPDAAWEWFDSLHSFESDLGIIVDPSGEHAWLAVQAKQFAPPLLILRLPLFNRPVSGNPF